ncbi:MAG: thiamine diphosphokinase [Defluviitaleaceae bacterium]|nr:thiamine diphosphokinase [Defluviitaleaceae bacterium]
MRAVLFANGEVADLHFLEKNISPRDVFICCDGGARYAEALGVTPDYLVGDMDSVPPEILEKYKNDGVKLASWPVDKDFTDLELAVAFARGLGADAIDIFGALGGRVDHAMANIFILAQAVGAARIVEPDCAIYSVGPERELEITGAPGDIVSILPVGEAHGVTTACLRYPLARESLYPGFARGVSNRMLASRARVALEKGVLIVFHTTSVIR